MRIILGLTFILFVSIGFSQTTKKVLFIGNSYTSANNLPDLISSLASADGNTLDFDAHTPGGSQLNQHATDPTVLNKIAANDWDFVVLQEQSQKPSFPDAQVANSVYPYAEILVDSIYANNECSIPLLYATWGRENGDPQWAGINTFEKMNTRLFNAYTHMSEQANGMMSPVGIGFAHIKQDTGAEVEFNELYVSDGSHPSIKGSYLAACIFNNKIYDNFSSGNTFLPTGISANEAEYLQEVADYVTYEVDTVQTNFRPLLSENTFTFAVNGAEVSLEPTITVGNFDAWNFGDGQSATQENITHQYNSNGAYEITMYSSTHCQSDSLKKEVIISTLNLSKEYKENFNVYPNPSSNGVVHIDLGELKNYTVHTLQGRTIYKGNSPEITLPKGVFIIRTEMSSHKIIVR